MKEMQIILTGKQSKELLKEGKTIYPRAKVGYVIEMVNGSPKVTALLPLDEVSYEVIIRK